jgi:hypothetical protein
LAGSFYPTRLPLLEVCMFPARRALDPEFRDLSLDQWRELITHNYNVDESSYRIGHQQRYPFC